MKITELRIGNWIDFGGLTYATVFNMYESGKLKVKNYRRDWDVEVSNCKGVPLTEEWLVKLGFKDKGLVMSGSKWFVKEQKFQHKKELRISKDRVGDWWNFTIECVCPPTLSLVSIKYAHQLQNLYFSLCGEELEVK
jgi:hypothetical protein